MQFYYGSQMPLRILDEAEFWKHQEEEHTVVIRELVSGLEQEYVDALNEWEKALAETHQYILRFIESVIRSNKTLSPALMQEVLRLVSFCLKQSEDFIELCRQIKTQSQAVSQNPTAQVVIDHIIRESEYFIGIAQALLYNQQTM
ncbi:protein of unknown function [Alteribacillus persepolensis]|uniref:DUF2935 domain-containing protein n=1 Tax=Alteribacillus persepolensis TaxID=568899 RepID=A0A1G8ED44_9BACI|nr:DUF2935 domain-containing protein [Alteribacillus persepolensis]SDH67788.1 protein of unknown function [Alteribacillus persepolensis]